MRLSHGSNGGREADQENAGPMSLMGVAGGASSQGGFSIDEVAFGVEPVDERKRMRQQSMLLLLGVGVVAAGSIWGMRLLQGDLNQDSVSTATAAKIEQVMVRISSGQMAADDPLRQENLSNLLSDTNEAVAMFTLNHADRQVPLEFVQKNPFATKVAGEGVIRESDGARLEKMREEQLQRVREAARQLRVNSIMAGENPRVFINSDLLGVGEKVGQFTIDTIENQSVILSAEVMDRTYRFRIGMQQQPTGNRR